MKVNQSVGLGTFAVTLGDKAQQKKGRSGGFVPLSKDPDAVPAPAMNLWAREQYRPPKNDYVRPGANDHLRIKSRGL